MKKSCKTQDIEIYLRVIALFVFEIVFVIKIEIVCKIVRMPECDD